MSAINFRQNIRRRLEFRLENDPKTPKLQAKHQGAAWNSAWKMTDVSPNFRLNIRHRLEFRLEKYPKTPKLQAKHQGAAWNSA